MCVAIDSNDLQRKVAYGDVGVEHIDSYELARWQPGVLSALAKEHGLAHLRAASRDLPSWFRFPVNATTGQVVVPTLLFLADQCLARNASHAAENTLTSYAYDFRQWLEFLALEGRSFDEADQAVFNEYVFEMAGDGEDGCARKTIRRRASALKQLYMDANARGLTDARFSTRIAGDVGRRPEATIRPISPADIVVIRNALGPLPSNRLAVQSSRLRLAFEIALFTGLRLFEVAALTTAQFRHLRIDSEMPDREHVVRLTTTKGGDEETVMFPAHLIAEIMAYVDGERGECRGGGKSDALLLNRPTSGANAGNPMSAVTLSADFRKAVRAAGLLRPLPGAHRYGAGLSTTAHTFHDIRHTFAVIMLQSLRGIVEDPWNEIRIRMRHEAAETTRTIYLAHLHEFEQPIGDVLANRFRSMVA